MVTRSHQISYRHLETPAARNCLILEASKVPSKKALTLRSSATSSVGKRTLQGGALINAVLGKLTPMSATRGGKTVRELFCHGQGQMEMVYVGHTHASEDYYSLQSSTRQKIIVACSTAQHICAVKSVLHSIARSSALLTSTVCRVPHLVKRRCAKPSFQNGSHLRLGENQS